MQRIRKQRIRSSCFDLALERLYFKFCPIHNIALYFLLLHLPVAQAAYSANSPKLSVSGLSCIDIRNLFLFLDHFNSSAINLRLAVK